MEKLYLCLVLFVAVVTTGGGLIEAATPNAVPVTVYYESLCPDSIKFYINQLYPTLSVGNFSLNVDLNLIPYGKSSQQKNENGTWSFTCHHGERECHGNKVHVCALKHIPSKNERTKYLNCLLKKMLPDRKAEFPTESCAKENHIAELDAIVRCANGTEGSDLLAEMGNKTQMLQPKLSSVPTVVFNNQYDQNDFQQAQTNFRGVVCKYISDPKPAECSGSSGTPAFSLSLLLLTAGLSFAYHQH